MTFRSEFPEAQSDIEDECFSDLYRVAVECRGRFGLDAAILMLASCMVALHKREEISYAQAEHHQQTSADHQGQALR